MKIYISGKMTGLPDMGKAAFNAAAAMLTAKGYNVVSPVELGAALESTLGRTPTWKEYMRNDLQAIADVDAIYLLANWRDSRGARIEERLARRAGKFVKEEVCIHLK